MGDQTSNTGGMSTAQMMYAMALMNSGNQSQGSGAYGGMSNAVSPMLRALMLNRMMNAGTSGSASGAATGSGGAGPAATSMMNPYSYGGQVPSMMASTYGGANTGAIGGNAPMFSNPYAPPSTAGAIAPATAGGGVGAAPAVSTLQSPYGSYGYGYSNPYGISGQTPSY